MTNITNINNIINECLNEATEVLLEILSEAAGRDIEKDAISQTHNINYHIFKLYVNRYDYNINHWCREITNFIYPLIRDKKQALSHKSIFKRIFKTTLRDELDKDLSNIMNDYSEDFRRPIDKININNFYDFHNDICEWMLNQILNLTEDPHHPQIAINSGNRSNKIKVSHEKYTKKYDDIIFDLTNQKYSNFNSIELYKEIKKLYTKY